ncbi:hypothetical protein B0I72DRAFT_164020 [Yarrowia lipolytica]|jgi:hypothetical protein|nr:hypothetical protein B0I72DRAFT_164020 [Yarrowia lipolytica]RDW41589.1 hypothetical protein B0I73DRAFT_162647 [Yarrowia lipolytica]RDW44969.1 hypothetical protein B0I74DRAFT_164367 [Yarrowia lipolytica]RDW53230.1 hypothetical protein B0I75DRAFT_168873 [Yarrowia lipolytica]SEI36472.1 YALIA101S12e00540g1_1 [Yarrowia lipolytica]
MIRRVDKHPSPNTSHHKWTESEISEAWKYVLRNSNATFTRRTWSKLTREAPQIATEPPQTLQQTPTLHPVATPEHKGILKTDSHFGATPSSPGAVRFAPTVTTIHYDTETSDLESEMDWEDVYEGPVFDDL